MNVLDLDVYMDVLYIVWAMCMFCNSSCASYTIFCIFLAKANLQRLGCPVIDKPRLTYNGWDEPL
jgi:hypothetical protein